MRTLKTACSAALALLLCGCSLFSDYPGGWENEIEPGLVEFPNSTFAIGDVGAPDGAIVVPLPDSVDDREAFIDAGKAVYRHFGMGSHDLGDGFTLDILEPPRARQLSSLHIPMRARFKGFWAFGSYSPDDQRVIAPGQEGDSPLPRVPWDWNSNEVLGHEVYHLLLDRQRPETRGKWHGRHWSGF